MTSTPPPSNVPDPLKVLESIIGIPTKEANNNGQNSEKPELSHAPVDPWQGSDLEGQSLQELAELDSAENVESPSEKSKYSLPLIDECMCEV